jgi:hypothetical protein
MSRKSQYFWLTKPAIVSASLLLATSAIASEPVSGSGSATSDGASINSILNQVEEYNPIDLSQGGDEPLQRVNSVNQLRDVRPTDWAYTALQNLAQRHGCLLAYPNGEYRGNRAMTRYEFAAGLDACLDQIQRQLATLDTGVSASDLEALRRLQQEFEGELTVLRRRVDALEVRTAELEANQFSTTTKLFGESIFALVGASGGSATNSDVNGELALGTRTRLNFDTSFSGQDLLRTRLQVATLDSFAQNNTFTPEGDLFFNAGLDQDGSTAIGLDSLLYSTNLGDKTRVTIIANAGAVDDFASTVVPLDGDGGSGAVSRFGTRPPIYNMVTGTGVGLTYDAGKAEVSLGYLAGNDNLGRSAASPLPQNGLFDGPYGAIAQLVLKPVDGLKVGLTYVNAYNKDTQTGSIFATPVSSIGFTTSTNAYGLQFGYETADMPIKLGGWLGYTDSTIQDSGLDGDMAAWNWAVTLGVDAGPPGSQLGLIVGMEPKVTSSDGALAGLEDANTSIHIEGFYEYQLSNNISITPAFVWLTAPDHNSNNDDLVIGTLRTTFRF